MENIYVVEIERLKKEIKMLESQKKGLEFSLVERKNRLLAEEMIEREKEKTSSETWLKKYIIDGSNGIYTKSNFLVFRDSDMIAAYEAGQKINPE